MPSDFGIVSIAPNPAGGAVTVRFHTGAAGRARMAVYDLRGREVAVLVGEPVPAGAHAATWDGAGVPAGAYLVRLRAGGREVNRTLTVLR
jgi:hypothetical protein